MKEEKSSGCLRDGGGIQLKKSTILSFVLVLSVLLSAFSVYANVVNQNGAFGNETFETLTNWTNSGCTTTNNELVCTPSSDAIEYLHQIPFNRTNNWTIEADLSFTSCSTDFAWLVSSDNQSNGFGTIGYSVHNENGGSNPEVDSPAGSGSDQTLSAVDCSGTWAHWKVVFFLNKSVGTYINNTEDLTNPDSMMDYSSRGDPVWITPTRNQGSSFHIKMDNFTVYNGTSYPGNVDEPAPASELNVLAYDQFNSVANWSGGCTVLPGELVCDTPLNEEAFYIHRLPNVTENNNNWSVEFDMAIPDCDTDWAILVTEKNDTGGEIGYGVHKEGIGTHPKVDSPDGNTSHDQELKEIICYEENAIVKWHHWKIVFFQNQSVGTYIDNVVNLSNPDSMMDYSSNKKSGFIFPYQNG